MVRLSATARICIAGQAPGLRVHESGIPFNDPSGDRLRDWMAIDRSIFYDQDKLAIVPMGFCFPGYDAKKSDLPPRKECRVVWHDKVFSLMPQIELILVIGRYAQNFHMSKTQGKTVTETVVNWRQAFANSDRPKVLPLPHPSWRNTGWIKRNPWFEQELLPVLRSEVVRLL
ncbi:MAG: uracil-DNA glycosylase family protein [Rhizobiaceae bacterium]